MTKTSYIAPEDLAAERSDWASSLHDALAAGEPGITLICDDVREARNAYNSYRQITDRLIDAGLLSNMTRVRMVGTTVTVGFR